MQNKKISLKNISKVVWHNITIIVISTLIFGLAGGLYAKHKRHTDYVSTRTMMTGRSYRGSAANEEVQADINMGKTYAEIVESDNVAQAAHRKLPKNIRKQYSTDQISSMVKAHPIMQTTMVKVSVKAGTAKASSSIVNSVTEKAADAQSITSPSIKKYALIGAAVGFLLGMVVSFSITTWTKII